MQIKMPHAEQRMRTAAMTRSADTPRTRDECGPAMVVGPNAWYANMLMNTAFGSASEMTAIQEYRYYSIMTDDPELMAHYRRIMQDEVSHLHLTMELIRMLGENPHYHNSRGVHWTASYMYFGRSDCDRLSYAVDAEREAAAEYRRMAGLIADPNISRILLCFARDEDSHGAANAAWARRTCGYNGGEPA